MTLTTIDRSAPTVTFSTSNVTANGFKISATSSATADIWQYSTNGGSSWTQFSTTASTSASVTLSSLSPNTSYTVRVRARRQYNHVYGTSGSSTVKTLGGAVVNSVNTVTADNATVSIKPIDNIGNRDYLQVLAYMFRFDAQTGYYLYPEAENSEGLRLRMNRGSTYEANVIPREDISITKHGLKIPMDATDYAGFVSMMKVSEQEFMSAFC